MISLTAQTYISFQEKIFLMCMLAFLECEQ
jgi:hypothetical protein